MSVVLLQHVKDEPLTTRDVRYTLTVIEQAQKAEGRGKDTDGHDRLTAATTR